MDEELIPTWGYKANGEAEIFQLKPGEKLPADWADTPAAFIKTEEAANEDAADDVAPSPRRGRPPKVREDGTVAAEEPVVETALEPDVAPSKDPKAE